MYDYNNSIVYFTPDLCNCKIRSRCLLGAASNITLQCRTRLTNNKYLPKYLHMKNQIIFKPCVYGVQYLDRLSNFRLI